MRIANLGLDSSFPFNSTIIKQTKEVAMPPAAKRRKVSAVAKVSSGIAPTQRGIQAFGKISKSQAQPNAQIILKKEQCSIQSGEKIVAIAAGDKKRKLEPIEAGDEGNGALDECATIQRAASQRSNVPERSQTGAVIADNSIESKLLAKVRTPTKNARSQQKALETPTKGARSLLENFALSSSASNGSPWSSQSSQQTPPSSPASINGSKPEGNTSNELPEELQDLINLHSSFLTALSLHYAHNGSMTPADLRNLRPSVERVWRKRRVTTEDVCRILALERETLKNGSEKDGPLSLTDYGHGKICIEVTNPPKRHSAQKRPINEEALNGHFYQTLRHQWSHYKTHHPSKPTPSAFLSALPTHPITPHPSLSKLAPLLSKGQLRLSDLKAGAIRAQQAALRITTANISPLPNTSAKAAKARTTDLFSRLAAKQLHQSTLPLPPSSETLARRSALQRLPEVAPVIESLSTSSKKHCDDDAAAEATRVRVTHASFTMPTLVQHLQMSLRNPIGKEEAVKCVRLLAEVVPEWIGVREVGRLVGVTVRGEGVGRDELRRRIGAEIGEG